MDKKHMKDKAIKLRKIPAVSFKDTAGITLSALVVTIIVLIMLAGVTINVTIGENGIIKKAKETEIQQEIIEITQELKMKKIKVALLDGNKGKVTISEYIEVVQNDEDMEYKITDTQIIDEETAYIIIGEEYEYLLQQEEDGDLKITYQGIANQSLPRIQDLQISSSENEIEVKVMATRVEKYVFYIKEKDAAEYIKKEENETGEYIFRELTSNKEYSIKVEAINENGKSEREINQITGGMIELTPSEVKYIKSDTNWTNEDVTTTIEIDTDKNITNYELQYTKFTEGAQVTSGALENATWLKYETTGIVSEENEIIYTRLYNGNNATSYTSTTIANIDKEAPTISETLNSSGVTTKGFTLNIGVTDISSGLGKIIWYYKLSNASNYSSQEEIYTPLNGVATGEKAAVTKSITLDNLTNGTYSVYAEVYDVAGNSTETEKINIPLVGITQASGATVSPEYWTNGTVIVTLPTQDGFTMEYQTGTLDEDGTWIPYDSTSKVPVSNNTTVYYRYNDGKNPGQYGSEIVNNIDTENPRISTTLNATGVTTKGFTLNIGVTDTSSGLGRINWCYKLSTESTYTIKSEIYTPLNGTVAGETTATKSITLDNLTNGTYDAYVVIYDVAGNSIASSSIKVPLGTIAQASGATASPAYWTSGTVTVTLPTQSGFTTEYQIGTLNEAGTWTPYNSTSKVPVSSNTTVYYRYNDGKNVGVYGSKQVSNIDTENPTISTTLNATGVTTKGFTLNIGVADTSSGLGRINWCYKLSTESTYTIKSEIYTPLNGTVAGETTTTKSITLDNLTNGTYDAYVVIYDVAGNSIASSSIKIPLGTIAQASGATASPAYWTSGTVTVTLPTQSGFTTEYQTGTVNENGTWTPYNSTSKVPVSSNTTVYYRYNDGKNVGVYGSKQVSNIDTADPTISTALSGSVASKDSITLNIGVRDINSGLGKIVWYYKTSNASTYSSQESPYTTINGTITGTTTAVSATKTISGLTNGQTYNIYAVVYDVAGNSIQTDKIDIKLVVTVAASAIKKGVFIEYDVEYTDTYYDTYKYTTTNGWRLLDYKTRDDGKTLYDVQLMSTGIPARMYFYNDDKINNYSKWITDSTKLNEFKAILGNGYNHYTGTNYYALQASAGYYYNLGEMTFTQGTSYDLHNMGYYTTVKNGDTNYTTGVTLGNNLFKTSQASSVRMLTLPELNKALGRTDIDSVSRITDTTGLFQLNQLNSVLSGKSYSEGFYWLASPRPNNALNVCYMASAGFVYGGLAGSHGVRPVVTLSSDIQLVEAVNSEGTTYYEIVNK